MSAQTDAGFVELLRRASRFVDRDKRGRWGGLVLLAIAVSLFEAVGAFLVFALLAIVGGSDSAFRFPLIGDVRALFPGIEERELKSIFVVAVATFFLLRSLLLVGQSYAQNRIPWNAGTRLAGKLHRAYLSLPYEFHLRRNSSELIRNCHDLVTEVVSQVFVPVVMITSQALIVLGVVAVLLTISPVITIIMCVTIIPLVLVLVRLVQPKLEVLSRRNIEALSGSYRWLRQSFSGLRDIRLLGRERYFADKFIEQRMEFAQTQIGRSVFVDVPRIIVETILVLSIVLFVGLTLVRPDAGGNALSVLGLYAYAVLRLMPSIHRIVNGFNNLRFGGPAVEELDRDLRRLEGLPEARCDGRATEPMAFERVIELRDVRYTYGSSHRAALQDVSLSIPRGASIGLVGPTGGGKTTLVDVIMGLLPPTNGRVLVDGSDIGERLAAWQLNIGMVPQAVFLLDDSLRRNIALGLRDEEIDERAVKEAIQIAQLSIYVESLPEGLDTTVGEHGVRLSGGQRQRVAIARALYRAPSVVIFDEGTSALDNTTESALIAAIDALRGERTIITVAHRLSTVRRADRIALIVDGQINQVGSYDELLSTNATFQHLARQDAVQSPSY